MRRSLADGYELDDDRDRIDVDAVHAFLSTEAYWVPGRSRETIGRVELVREAVEDPGSAHCAWYLNTRDAHGLSERFGFQPADPGRTMVRPRPT